VLRAFANPRFRQFALAKFLSLLAQNSLIYAVFILVIEREDSPFATSLYVVAAIVPSVLLSVPGGLAADSLPRKAMLVGIGALRVAVVVAFMVQGLAIGTVLVLTLVLWSVWQFYTPAENGALPAVIEREELAGANSSLQVVSIVAQLVGAGFLAPVGLKVAGENVVFAICAALIVVASAAYASIPQLTPAATEERPSRDLLAGIRMLRADPLAMQAALILGLVSSALMVVVVAVPEFLQETLRTKPGNAVYIFSPAAGGLAIGLAVAPMLARALGSRAVSLIGYVAFAACLLALGNIGHLADFWVETARVPLDEIEDRLRISRAIASTLLVVPVAGLGLAFVNVGARTLLYERAPGHAVGQLLAAQSALGSVLGIAPTLAAGLVIERLDVDAVLIGLSAVLAGLGALQVLRQPPPRELAPSAAG
jgi:MFS family permease